MARHQRAKLRHERDRDGGDDGGEASHVDAANT